MTLTDMWLQIFCRGLRLCCSTCLLCCIAQCQHPRDQQQDKTVCGTAIALAENQMCGIAEPAHGVATLVTRSWIVEARNA